MVFCEQYLKQVEWFYEFIAKQKKQETIECCEFESQHGLKNEVLTQQRN